MTAILTQDKTANPDRTKDNHQRTDRRLLVGYLHKTSNTLCGIKGYASLIADRENTSDKTGNWARKIIREVERMEDIFRSVGDMTRGKGNPDLGLDLARFIVDSAAVWAQDFPGLNLSPGSIPSGELKLPTADLALILNEILKNCAECAAGQPGDIQVRITGLVAPGGRVFLEVTDNGCGMNNEIAGQACHPFVTTKDDHHGVGLTRVDTLMDMYGLEWFLESQEGKGTRVVLEVADVF